MDMCAPRMAFSPNQPGQTLGGDVGLGLELVPDEVLDVLGLKRGSEVALSEFLGHKWSAV